MRGERSHGFADFAVLLAIIGLALITWGCFAGMARVPAWKPWLAVTPALLLGLASLTRHRAWERRLRAAAGLWMLLAPLALNFLEVAPVGPAYLAIGAIVTALPLIGPRPPVAA